MKKKKRENNPLALLLILRMKVFPQCKYKGKRIMICARMVWLLKASQPHSYCFGSWLFLTYSVVLQGNNLCN